MTSDRRLIEDFIPIWKFLPRLREKSIRKGIFQRCICGDDALSGGTAAVFASLVAAPETYQKHLFEENDDWPSPMGGREPTIKDARKKILEAQRNAESTSWYSPQWSTATKGVGHVRWRWSHSLESLRWAVKLMPLTSTQWLTSLSFAPWFIPKYGKKLAMR